MRVARNSYVYGGVFLFGILGVCAKPPYSGGDTSIVLDRRRYDDRGVFGYPAANLSLRRKDRHFIGNSFFESAWVTAPSSTTARDGLGPMFNTMSCQSCHIKDGRGRPPETGEQALSILLRVSSPGGSSSDEAEVLKKHGVIPHPTYGSQIQNNAIMGVKPEASLNLQWEETTGSYPDGTGYSLRKPKINLTNPGYGDFPPDLEKSLRVAPQMIGIGLLDTVDESTLEKLEDPDDGNGDGVSGRRNLVWNEALQKTVTGRFGWKAEQPTARQQVASAFIGDIGITSSLFPDENQTAAEKIDLPGGGKPEVSDEILEMVTFYTKTLAVPAQRFHDHPTFVKGKELFKSIGCVSCHVDTMRTGVDPGFPELSNQEIHPYTDLLLHDMGEGLADDRPSFAASGREWRTAPLWGIGLIYRVNQHTYLLHDGRARSIEEAVLWHGGEAEGARDRFMGLADDDRKAIIGFLETL